MATWIIGDIHGWAKPLSTAIDQIPKTDTLIFLGDYVDRGGDVQRVVDTLLEESNRSIFLRGNHEDVMLAHFGLLDFVGSDPQLRGPDSLWLRANFGARATLDSYGISREDPWEALPAEHRSFFQGLRMSYEADDFIAVHAGLRINGSTRLDDQDPGDLLWIRWEWTSRESEWLGKHVYFGHFTSIQMFGRENARQLLRGQRSLGLDTGCGYGGFLSAWCHETGELIQVPEH